MICLSKFHLHTGGSPLFTPLSQARPRAFRSIPEAGFIWHELQRRRANHLSAGTARLCSTCATNTFSSIEKASVFFLRGGIHAEWCQSNFWCRGYPLSMALRVTQEGRSWKELDDRVVVNCYESFPTFRVRGDQQQQFSKIEVFYGGRIRLTISNGHKQAS